MRLLNLPDELATRANFDRLEMTVNPAGIQLWIDAGRRFGIATSPLNPQDFLYETVR